MFASSQLDPVVGLDIHMEMVPTPAPVPMPFPMPFVGIIEFAPAVVLVEWGLAKAIAWATSTPPAGPVLVNGFHATKTGDLASNKETLPHMVIPPGTMWTPLPKPLKLKPKPPPPPPDNPAAPAGDAVFVTGSKTVYFEGFNACRLGTLAMSCGDPVRLPSSTLIAIPKGAPVIVGGPPAFDWTATGFAFFLRNKWTAGLLQELISTLKPGRLRNLLGWAACHLTGHPVDVATGRLLTRAEDFVLRGPIPIRFERYYASSWAERDSSLGFGWSHTLDERVWVERGKVVYKGGDGREIEFHTRHLPERRMRPGDQVFYPIDRLTLKAGRDGAWNIRGADGLTREFQRLPGDEATSYLTAIRNRVGQSVRLSYDEHRQLRKAETSEGRAVRFEHTQGRLARIAVRTPDGEGWYDQVRFHYSDDGDLVRAVDSLGHARAYRYEEHLLIQETDRDGVRFWFEYDGRNSTASCVRTWGDDGKGCNRLFFREITYDKRGGKTFVEDSLGHTTVYAMNVANAVVSITDPHGAQRKFEYDDHLRKTTEIDALGHATRYEYDARGNETKRVLPNGGEYEIEYSPHDEVTRVVDPTGAEWRWTYDGEGRLLRHQTPATTFFFDHTGFKRTVVYVDAERYVVDRDAFGDVSAITCSRGTRVRRWYDRLGRLIKVRDAIQRVRRVVYDSESRVVEVTVPGAIVRRLRYSPEGDVLATADGVRSVTYGYAGHHKPAFHEEGGARIEYLYNSEDDLVGLRNEAGEPYVIERDACGRVVKEIGFDGRAHQMLRNALGQVTTLIKPSHKAHKFEHDSFGRLTKVAYEDGTADAFTYDAAGALETATNASGTVCFERDASRRIVAESFGDHWVKGHYSGKGARDGVSSSLGLEQSITRSPLDDVLRVVVGGQRHGRDSSWMVDFRRDAAGQEMARHLPGGVTIGWARTEAGLPSSMTVSRAGQGRSETEYEWLGDARLRAMRSTEWGLTEFWHDERGRLAGAMRSPGADDWRHPGPTGNLFRTRERRDRKFGPGGVLLEDSGTRYEHDADGNIVSRIEADGSRWAFEWSDAGLLKRVVRPDGREVRFAYDALRRRVEKRFDGVTTRWVWDLHRPAHEIVERAEARKAGQAAPPEVTTWLFEPDTFAPLGKVNPDGSRYAIVTDYLGTPVEMCDEAGRAVWKGRLDTWGKLALKEGRSEDCPWRWPGQYEDRETGLYYNRHRFYDPKAGQYASQDPIRLFGGPSPYTYAADPLFHIDPLGLAECRTREVAEGFSPLETSVVSEVKNIPLAQLRMAFEAGGAELNIGGRTILVDPGVPSSGLTLFGENGFVLGREAFASDAELTKTLLHETFRLASGQAASGATQAEITAFTKGAATFAERAFGAFF